MESIRFKSEDVIDVFLFYKMVVWFACGGDKNEIWNFREQNIETIKVTRNTKIYQLCFKYKLDEYDVEGWSDRVLKIKTHSHKISFFKVTHNKHDKNI